MERLILMDSSVLCEWLGVPGHSNGSTATSVRQEMKRFVREGSTLFLPLAAIVEVGNLIATVDNGDRRRRCADGFVALVRSCLEKERPFATIALWTRDDVTKYVERFVGNATCKISFGDTSIIREFEKMCEANPTAREIRIWTTDGHLDSYRKEITASLHV